jgi:hypothetical protein
VLRRSPPLLGHAQQNQNLTCSQLTFSTPELANHFGRREQQSVTNSARVSCFTVGPGTRVDESRPPPGLSPFRGRTTLRALWEGGRKKIIGKAE